MQEPTVETIEKRVAFLLAAVYALGVVVISFHLAEYKVLGQLGLLKPIYLFAGAYAILPVALSFAFWCLFAFALRKGTLLGKRIVALVLLALMWALTRAELKGFDVYIAKDFPLKWDSWMWAFLSLTMVLGGAAYVLVSGRWKLGAKINPNALTLLAIPGLLVWMVYGFTFTLRLYNRIPASWGGTRSFYVEFVLDPKEKEVRAEMEKAGLEFYAGTTRTKGTKLIIETENDYICAVKQIDRAQTKVSPLLLRRSAVLAVKYGSYSYASRPVRR